MKIKPEHYAYMEQALANPKPCEKYAHQPLPELENYLAAGMTARRYRWDLSYWTGLSKWICENVYQYANDDHVDTALRKITGTN